MTIHEKRTRGFFKLFIMVLCLCLSMVALTACSDKIGETNKNSNEKKEDVPSKNTEIKGEEQVTVNAKLTKIAFEKNNNIYLYDEMNKEIKSLGDNSKSKELLSLSPDKTKIVFRYFDEEKAIYPPYLIVYDIPTTKLKDIVIDNKNTQQITELKWIDNENILVTGHINPSASGYAVYSIKTRLELISCLGTIRDVNINKKNILYSNTPHIFPQPKANLYINGNKIFEANNDKEQIFDGGLSKDGKMLVFRSWVPSEKDLNGEAIAYLNIAKINSDGKGISDLKKISISSNTTGDIKFDDKNNISIIGDEFIYKLKADKLIKEKNTSPKQVELSAQQLEKFKEILAKQFPEDFISQETLLEDMGIYNMVAF
jgi:hypothetical protein